MIRLKTILKKFDRQGEKTGWTYVEIPFEIAEKLKKGRRTSFRVKGRIDKLPISQAALLPMGDGTFILPVNASMRKSIGKRQGATVELILEADDSEFRFAGDFIECLEDDPAALAFFNTLPGSHQKYFSKWIDSAKTTETKIRRITMAVNALARKMGYAEMIRSQKK
jgi:hypothetical protein